ncbi:MAG: ATP-binding cassette domain-containing protein, partial [Eubacterium sp.]|nr:ATP-binding cassette domain-containing protein [Eubacterium sp.]
MSLIVDIEKQLGSFSLKMKFEIGTEVLALLGASGSGKSMTLKCIAGIEKPDRGYIELDGRVLYDSGKGVYLTPQKRHIGYLFQQYALFPNMTVRQNILCGIRRPAFAEKRKPERKQSVLDAETRVSEMIRTMHLKGLEDKFPSQISGGEQQRTALARILVNDPEVLLLDEPFSALDTHLRFRLEQELRELLRQFHKPVLLVSHDRDEAYRIADRIAVIRAGAMETIGAKQEVFADPQTVDAARLTGCKNISRIRQEGADARHF